MGWSYQGYGTPPVGFRSPGMCRNAAFQGGICVLIH